MIEIFLAGFLFWFIIITNIVSGRFGYDQITFSDLDPEAKLKKISDEPKKFKIGVLLILIEHFSIISLAVMLFIAFSPYNIILAVVWIIFRTGEGLIQIYNKIDYWGLLKLARKYLGTSGSEKNSLSELTRTIFKTKNSIFTLTQILFSIGTLAYSILFVTSEVVHPIIGWFGIVASIIYGFGNAIRLVISNKVLWSLGGLLILIFEIVLGGWLLFSSLI